MENFNLSVVKEVFNYLVLKNQRQVKAVCNPNVRKAFCQGTVNDGFRLCYLMVLEGEKQDGREFDLNEDQFKASLTIQNMLDLLQIMDTYIYSCKRN